MNRAWHEGTGYSDDELAARRFGDLVHPDSRARCADVMARAQAGETLAHVELILVTAGGHPDHGRGQHELHRQRRTARSCSGGSIAT